MPSLLLEFVFFFAYATFVMPGLVLTEAQKVDLPQLEPALESLLRSADLNENLIELFRFRKILDRQLFVALDADEQAIIRTFSKAFQLDADEFDCKLELAKISKAWSTAKVQADTKRKVDAVQKAHGEPVQLLSEDWASLMRAFKKNMGNNTHLSSRSRVTSRHSKKNSPQESSRPRPLHK